VILRSPDPESRTADVAASLRSAGVLGNSEIASVTEERISSKGLMSVLTRITAEFAVQAPGTPGTLILKQEPDDAASARVAVRLRMADRECSFYRDNPRLVSPRAPRCYRADGPRGGRFSLLIEDLGSLVQPDQVNGCAAEMAAAVVVALACLHARTWARTRLAARHDRTGGG
jgi:hypothetical protein